MPTAAYGSTVGSGLLASSPAFLWEVPQKPVSVRLNLEMVSRLDRKVVQAFRPGPEGAEIGGLLLGSTYGSPGQVTLDDFELIPCDYGFGPLYQLTTQDRLRFVRCASARSAAGPQVVGFFRSHTRPGLALDADDVRFCSALFGQPHHVVLLVRPSAGEVSTAGIFIWEDGGMRTEASYREFPFSQDALLQLVLAATPSVEKAAAVPQPAAEPQPTAEVATAEVVVEQVGVEEVVAPGAPLSQAAPAAESPKRGHIVPIVARRETAPAPAASPAPRREVSPKPAPAAEPLIGPGGAELLPGRVGRCCVKVQLRPAVRG